MSKKKSFYILLIIFTTFLRSQAASNLQELFVGSIQTKSSVKELSLDFIKKHPFLTATAGAVAAGGLIYGGWYSWDYYKDKRNPLEALLRGHRNRPTGTFNRAIGFLQNSDQINTAMCTYRLSASERSQLLNKQAHKFSINNAMRFLSQAGDQLSDDYTNLTARNPTLLSPEAALEWCSNNIIPERLSEYTRLINLFLRPNLNLSDNVKRKTITPLFLNAWNSNDYDGMRFLYNLGADPNMQIDGTGTLFNAASMYNQMNKLIFLLELTPTINISGRTFNLNDSALHLATNKGHVSIVEILLTRCKIDPNLQNAQQDTPLHLACKQNQHEIIIKLLASPGININLQNSEGKTPLHILCMSGQLDLVEKISANPNILPDLADSQGCTPLLTAYKALGSSALPQHARAIFMHLIQRPDINYNAQDSEGNTVLHLSLKANDLDTAKLLLSSNRADPKKVNNAGKSVLYLAVEMNLIEIVRICIENYKMSLHTPDHCENSPLFVAAHNPSMLDYFIRQDCVTGNERDVKGNTLFHVAIKRKYNSIFRDLLSLNKVDVNAQNNKGKTPLHLLYERGLPMPILELLEQQNVNVFLRDSRNRSLLGLLRAQHENIYNAIQTHTPDNISLMPKVFSPIDGLIAGILIEKMKESHCSDAQKIKTITDRLSQPSQCPICIDSPEKPATTLCCFGAKYCEECLKELMKQPHPKCPQCREVLFKEMAVQVPSDIHFVRKIFIPIPCEGLSINEPSEDMQTDIEIRNQLMAAVKKKIDEANFEALRQTLTEHSHTHGGRLFSAQDIFSSLFADVSSSNSALQNLAPLIAAISSAPRQRLPFGR